MNHNYSKMQATTSAKKCKALDCDRPVGHTQRGAYCQPCGNEYNTLKKAISKLKKNVECRPELQDELDTKEARLNVVSPGHKPRSENKGHSPVISEGLARLRLQPNPSDRLRLPLMKVYDDLINEYQDANPRQAQTESKKSSSSSQTEPKIEVSEIDVSDDDTVSDDDLGLSKTLPIPTLSNTSPIPARTMVATSLADTIQVGDWSIEYIIVANADNTAFYCKFKDYKIEDSSWFAKNNLEQGGYKKMVQAFIKSNK